MTTTKDDFDHGEYFINKLFFTTNITLNDKNKKVITFPKNWQNLNKDELHNDESDGAYCLITGERNNLFVIDFDDVDIYNELKEKYEILNNCFRVKTKKGYHCYFKFTDGLTPNNKKANLQKVDLLNNGACVVGAGSKVNGNIYYDAEYLGRPDLECPKELIDEIYQKYGNGKNKELLEYKNLDKDYNNMEMELKLKIVNLINNEYLDNYGTWRDICWAMDYEGFNIEQIRTISKKSNKYDENGFNNLFNNFVNNGSMKMGTLNYYARLSNETEYIKLMGYTTKNFNKFFNDLTDDGFAQLVFDNIGDDFIYQDDNLYIYFKDKWYKNNRVLCKKVISAFLQNTLTKILNILSNSLGNGNDDEQELIEKKIKVILQGLKKIKTVSVKNNILEALIIFLSGRLDNIEFDKHPYYLGFDNGVYDLKNKIFMKKQKHFYMTMSTNFNYNEQEDYKNVEFIQEFIEKIFPIEEERILYCCLLMRSFIGINNDKFVIANGCGGNGKSILHSLTYLTQGDYGYNIPNVVLTKPIKDGPNPEVAELHNKRFCYTEEPPANVGFSNATIKQLTGGANGVRARMCNSNNTKIHNTCSLFVNCNEKPRLQDNITDADVRRIFDILFRSLFTSNPDNSYYEYTYQADLRWLNDEFMDSYKNAYFIYLTRYLNIINADGFNFDKITPSEIKNRTNKYLTTCDVVSSWFFDNYEKSNDDTDVIQIKNIYEDFKESEGFINMNKKEKRLYNKSYFIEKVSTNVSLRKFYRERETRKIVQEKYAVKQMRNVLIGFKLKVDIDEE